MKIKQSEKGGVSQQAYSQTNQQIVYLINNATCVKQKNQLIMSPIAYITITDFAFSYISAQQPLLNISCESIKTMGLYFISDLS